MIIDNGTWTVYCHINKINGKMYIGITSKENPNERWRDGKGYHDTPHFFRAIVKYGWNNFEHIIVASHLTEDEACNMEKLLIRELNLLDDKYGYNISEGGNKGCLMRGEHHPMFGKHHTEETRQKISRSKKGQTVVLDQIAKDKISKALKGNHNGTQTKVYCVETGVTYPSAAESHRQTGADSSAIIKCINGKLYKTRGLHWKLIA